MNIVCTLNCDYSTQRILDTYVILCFFLNCTKDILCVCNLQMKKFEGVGSATLL